MQVLEAVKALFTVYNVDRYTCTCTYIERNHRHVNACTVEPSKADTIGTWTFALYREVSLTQGLGQKL